jgi:hypothetical protein
MVARIDHVLTNILQSNLVARVYRDSPDDGLEEPTLDIHEFAVRRGQGEGVASEIFEYNRPIGGTASECLILRLWPVDRNSFLEARC